MPAIKKSRKKGERVKAREAAPKGSSLDAPAASGNPAGAWTEKRLLLRFFFQFREIIGIRLHHLPALRQVLSIVVRGPHSISLTVGKLALDPIAIIALLVEYGGSHAPEAVNTDFMLFVTHTA